MFIAACIDRAIADCIRMCITACIGIGINHWKWHIYVSYCFTELPSAVDEKISEADLVEIRPLCCCYRDSIEGVVADGTNTGVMESLHLKNFLEDLRMQLLRTTSDGDDDG